MKRKEAIEIMWVLLGIREELIKAKHNSDVKHITNIINHISELYMFDDFIQKFINKEGGLMRYVMNVQEFNKEKGNK